MDCTRRSFFKALGTLVAAAAIAPKVAVEITSKLPVKAKGWLGHDQLAEVLKRVYGDKMVELFAQQQSAWERFNKSVERSAECGTGYHFNIQRNI